MITDFLEEILENHRNFFIELFSLPTIEESCVEKYGISLTEYLEKSYRYEFRGVHGIPNERIWVFKNMVNPDDYATLDELETALIDKINEKVRGIFIGSIMWTGE